MGEGHGDDKDGAGTSRRRSVTAQTTPLSARDLPRSPVADEVAIPAQDVRLPPGTLLARRYRIERFVAAGGMGEVYEATDVELRTRLAVKTVRAQIEHDPAALERVRREVQLARAVTDPNVCRIFDIGHAEVGERRLTFITMELLEGETLHARLKARGTPFTVDEALPLAGDLLRGLEAVHRAGVVHRDLKAENVLLVRRDDRDHAVLTDFGIARAQHPEGGGDASALTQEGMMVGSPAFMAPEQINGTRITPRTDVFAVGAILWELVVGRWPLRGEETVEIVRKVAGEFPGPHDFPADVDPRWAAVIQRCRLADPAQRVGSAQAVLDALTTGAGLVVALPTAPVVVPPRRRRGWLVGGVALTALSGGALWWQLRGEPPAAIAPSTTAGDTAPPATPAQVAAALLALDHARARALSAALPTSDPAAPAAYWQALAASTAGDWDAAVAAALRAQTAPGLPRPVRLRIDVIMQRATGDLEGALASLEALHTLAPDDPVVALDLAEAQIPLRKVVEAGKVLDGIEPIATGVTRARVLLNRGNALATTSGFDNAALERLADGARAEAVTSGAPVIEGRALMLRGLARLFLGRTDEAEPDVTRGLELLTSAGDTVGLCVGLRVRAVITYNTEPVLEPVLAQADRAIEACTAVRDDLSRSLALNVRGSTLNDMGRIDEARAAFQASIDAAAAALRPDAADTRASVNLGVLNMDTGALNAAEAIYVDLQSRDALDGTGLGLLNMSDLARGRADVPAARDRLRRAIELLDKSKSQYYRATQYLVESLLAFETGAAPAAATALRRAEAAVKASGTGSIDWNLILTKARIQFASDRRAALTLLAPAMKAEGLTTVVQGVITYMTARALLADGQRAAALALRTTHAADPRWPRYHEVQLHARLLDAELATTPAERAAAQRGLEALGDHLRRDGFTSARWEAELGLARLAVASGDAARARTLVATTAREATAAGFERLATAARAVAVR